MNSTHAPRAADQITARLALACLDLTSLNDADTADDVRRLCARADGPCGRVAAVCVWPRFVKLARAHLPDVIGVAAVANFPAGGTDTEAVLREVAMVIDGGGQEIDLVLPYRSFLHGRDTEVRRLLASVRAAAPGLVLKVILETGELGSDAAIARASTLALDGGADFLKTSTGKVPIGATPGAARVMLQTIAQDARQSAHAGFKASGGVRSVADAAVYLQLVEQWLGPEALVPARCRIGASSLLGEIESVLSGTV